MTSDDDDCDYMSDAFLAGSDTVDIRPGLVHNRTVKRCYELEKKRKLSDTINKDKWKPVQVLEEEKRTEGLDKPLTSENKGFSMLAKMGFNPGTGLGKHGQGRAEPVGIDVKTDKQGLGRQAAIKEIMERKRQLMKDRVKNAPSLQDYRARMTEKSEERQNKVDLYKSQKVCFSLDGKEGVTEPQERWFWPEFATEKETKDNDDDEEEEEEEEDQLSVNDQLDLLTLYLRRTYFYCIWCGAQYNDEEDMRDCPGSTRNDH